MWGIGMWRLAGWRAWSHRDAGGSVKAVVECRAHRVLATTGGHKARAAQILGVSRPRLNRLMEKYGLE